jgi:pimeloyl-ACP methyl ester carboxylesterase
VGYAGVRTLEVDSAGVRIHVEVTGEGRPVVLLHGFPDSGALWRHQVPALVDAGFQVVVPDLRGFGASGVPVDVEDYSMAHAAGDVVAVLDELGIARAHVVGHDFGAALAWALGAFVPGRVDHLVALSVGQASSFRASGVEQMARSWYVFFFQFPGIAEQWLAADDWANFRAWCGHPDADAVVARWEATGTLTAALNWYRANITPEGWVAPPLDLPLVEAPTMGVWSSGDFALTEAQMSGSGPYVAGPWRYERIEGAGHWMPLDAPDEVTRLLLDFLPA